MLRKVGNQIVTFVETDFAATPTDALFQEWRTPRHEDFRSRNAWSLFEAATEVMKGVNLNTAVHRTQALHGLFDGLVRLS